MAQEVGTEMINYGGCHKDVAHQSLQIFLAQNSPPPPSSLMGGSPLAAY